MKIDKAVRNDGLFLLGLGDFPQSRFGTKNEAKLQKNSHKIAITWIIVVFLQSNLQFIYQYEKNKRDFLLGHHRHPVSFMQTRLRVHRRTPQHRRGQRDPQLWQNDQGRVSGQTVPHEQGHRVRYQQNMGLRTIILTAFPSRSPQFCFPLPHGSRKHL